MTSPHTPGPWNYVTETLYGRNGEEPNYLIGGGAGDSPVAKVFRHHRDIQPYYAEANARLIAASPMLLEALEAMVKSDEAIFNSFGSKSDQAMQRIAAIDMAVAAISAARGE